MVISLIRYSAAIRNAEYSSEDFYSHQGWLTPDQSYFLHGDELDELAYDLPTRTRIWDVRDLRNPEVIGLFENTIATDAAIYFDI